MRNDLDGLTIARFFAALLVVMFHYHHWPAAVQTFIGGGWVAVTFFFLLSGFVLAYTARNLTSASGRKEFYLRRVARIYPVYLLAWALAAVVIVGDWDDASLSYIAKATALFGGLSISLLQAWVPGAAEFWNLPAWSLSVEAFFYASFPLIYLALVKQSSRNLVAMLVTCFVLNFGCAAVMSAEGQLLTGTPLESHLSTFLYYFPPLHLLKFVAGVALGILYVRHRDIPNARLWLAVSLTASVGVIFLHSVLPLWEALALAPFLMLIYALASVRPSGNIAATGVLLGKASYAMYILHWPIWYLMSEGRGETYTLFSVYLGTLIIASIVTYQYFEQPLERRIKLIQAKLPA